MFHRFLASAYIATIGLATIVNASSASFSGIPFGSFVIHNLSNAAVNYTVAWGDGEVESFTIAAGATRAHFTDLDDYGSIPTPTVVFDSVGGDLLFQAQSRRLVVSAVSNPITGKAYSFVDSASGANIDLYEG